MGMKKAGPGACFVVILGSMDFLLTESSYRLVAGSSEPDWEERSSSILPKRKVTPAEM